MTRRLAGPGSADIGNRQRVDDDVHQVVDNDDQPRSDPRRGFRVEAGCPALRPRPAAGPGAILQPRDLPGKVPAVDDEVRAADDEEGHRVLRNEQERQHVEHAMHGRSQRALRLLARHPFTLQQVVTDSVGNELIDGKHGIQEGA